jgi:hypothetical protein
LYVDLKFGQIKIGILTLISVKKDEKNMIYRNTDFKGAQGTRKYGKKCQKYVVNTAFPNPLL